MRIPLDGCRGDIISTAELGAETPEDGKRVLGLNLVDELPSRLDVAVDSLGQLDGLVAGRRAGDA